MTKEQYISNWHDGFVNFINRIIETIPNFANEYAED
jgi:hypothetical protein